MGRKGIRKTILTLGFGVLCLAASAQKELDQEVAFRTDNDLLAIYKFSDRHYTYGIFLAYRYKADKNKLAQTRFKSSKVLAEFSFGLQAFTPGNFKFNDDPSSYDRPFAGWQYLGYGFKINKPNRSLYFGANIGVLGPASQAGNIQNWYHNIIDDPPLKGWDYQVDNQLGFHLLFDYSRTLLSAKAASLALESSTMVGNVFLANTTALRARVGLLSPNGQSAMYGNRLAGPMKNECFFTFSAGYRFTGYNATIQGGIFNDQPLPVQEPNRRLGILSYGLFASLKRLSAAFTITHTRGEVAEALNHKYGSIQLGYVF